jgi:shikimate kinase
MRMERNEGNIVLLGFMGTGKSAVGRILAARLGRPLLDMDTLIEEREGRPIARIFAESGETFFRELERRLVQELAGRSGLVISTGGGVVLDSRNIDDFARSGTLVCLNASPETILRRVESESHRPLLERGDKLERIRAILAERRAAYGRVPHQIQTDEMTPAQVAERVLELYSG